VSKPESARQTKRIAVLDNEIEAQLLSAQLEERGIPHMMRSYYDNAYDGLFQLSKGWGHVEAPAEYTAEITEALETIRQAKHPEAGDSSDDAER
jgi:hypothetical protein